MKLTELFSSLANAVRKIKSSTKKMTPENCVKQLENINPYDGSNDLEVPVEKEQNYLAELIEGTLENVYDENITEIGYYAFYNCDSLTSANFPLCTSIGSSAFYDCSSLQTISFPACTEIGSSAFQNCSSLQTVSFPECTSIGMNAFNSCSSLESVYLNVSSVSQLDNKNAFQNTPLSNSSYLGRYGSIYVPVSLYEAFCSATNWSTYSQRIVAYFEGGNE